MKVGFTGSRKGMSARQKSAAQILVRALWFTTMPAQEQGRAVELFFHHGDCTGADEEFDLICRTERLQRVLHPAFDERFRAHCEKQGGYVSVRPPEPPLDRDRTIVEEVKLLIAAPAQRVEQLRSGTWATIRYAREEGVPVVILDP